MVTRLGVEFSSECLRWRAQSLMHLGEQCGVGIALGERNQRGAHGDCDLRAELEQFQSNRLTLGMGQGGAMEPESAKGLQ